MVFCYTSVAAICINSYSIEFLSLRTVDLLYIPEEYMIPCFIGIGRPAETAVYTKQIDVDYGTQIHWEMF
jgi:hypothetical protein